MFICHLPQSRLSPAELAKIFCNLEMLIMFHEQLVESLREQEALEPVRQTVGATILKYVQTPSSPSTLFHPLTPHSHYQLSPLLLFLPSYLLTS